MNIDKDAGSPTPDEPACHPCDRCGQPLMAVHCKLLCRNCGFMRDCSDP